MRLAGCLPDAMWLNTLTSCIKVSNICMDKASLLMPDCNFKYVFETLLDLKYYKYKANSFRTDNNRTMLVEFKQAYGCQLQPLLVAK